MKWFRLYDELVDDPKVQLLPLEQFRALINLWCVASQNNGRFPPLTAMAHKLHLKPAKMQQILSALQIAGFIDEDPDGLYPHNWNGRQFKSDGASGERVKRFRDRKRDGPSNADETLHEAFQKRSQKQSQNQIQKGESHQHPPESEATPARGQSLVSPEAIAIAEEIGKSIGFTKENWPPGWCGAALAIQKWLNDGCPEEVIKLAITTALCRKRDGPPENFSYFAKPIAAAFADYQRPNPAAPPQAFDGKINGHPSRKRTIQEVSADLVARLNAFDGTEEAGSGTSATPIRLLPPR